MPRYRTNKWTISPGQIDEVTATASSREPIYVDYLLWLSESGARRVLIGLLVCLAGLELIARVANPLYSRTAVSSLHGIRAIFQQAEDDPRPKVLAFGDSTLLGGGVADPRATVLGQWIQSRSTMSPVYNLAVPAGDSVTSALLLDRATRSRIGNVAGVIVEVIPSKFISFEGLDRVPAQANSQTVLELEHLIPRLDVDRILGEGLKQPTFSERMDTEAQWQLAHDSRFFRHRDWARTRVMGNYPILWLIGAVTPKRLMQVVFPAKSDGTNRLGANLEDAPFDPQHLRELERTEPTFAPEDQTTYLRRCLSSARQLHATPVILSLPMHLDAYHLSPAARSELDRCIESYERHLQQVAQEEHVELLLCRSSDFQDPALWTRTTAHFNRQGSRAIWLALKDRWLQFCP